MLTRFTASVRALSHKGHGVVDHPDGRVFFARGVWPGDVGIYQIEANAKNYDFAAVVELPTLSSDRVEVPCQYRADNTCGGCPWMMVSYEAQIKAKEQRITFLLSKNNIVPARRHSLLPSAQVFGYRNRAQFKTDGERLGFVMEGTNTLAPIEDCLILNSSLRGFLQQLRGALPNAAWKATDGHPWSYLDVDDSQTSVGQVVPNRRLPFRQGNSDQNEVMKSWIIETLQGVPRDYPVLEAFSGSGNLTQALSQVGFKNIVATEVRGQAVEALRAQELPGVQVLEIDMSGKGVWSQLARCQPHAKILLVDPPREGIEKRTGMFDELPELEMIIYISCEPATWARDVKDFQEKGWRVAHLTPMDLFPHTPHVEVLSLLCRA